jgi:putative membrane protein
MNERRALHPVYLLFGLLSTIKGFIPLIIIFLVRGSAWELKGWIGIAGVGAVAAIVLLLSYLDWKRFGFWLEEDRIIIRKGVLFRDEKTIYYTRIHSVNVEQPLIQRLLNVAQVKIETPGGSKKADGILPALSIKEANRIQHMLKRYTDARNKSEIEEEQDGIVMADEAVVHPTEVKVSIQGEPLTPHAAAAKLKRETARNNGPAFRLSPTQLLQAAVTSMNLGLGVAFIAGLYSFADDFLKYLLPDHFFDDIVEDSAGMLPVAGLIVLLAVLGLALSWLLSLIVYVLKYSGFLARRDGKQISVSYGLLEKKAYVFDAANVQAVIVKEGLLRQALGYAEIQLQIISSDKQEQLILHPFLKRQHVNRLLEDFLPRFALPADATLQPAPRRALMYDVRIDVLIALAICTGLIWWLGTAALVSLALPVLLFAWGYFTFRASAICLEDGQLALRERKISRRTYLVRRPQIVAMRVRRSPGQERRSLLSLSVHVLGSAAAYRVNSLDRKDVEPVWRWYSRSGGSRS